MKLFAGQSLASFRFSVWHKTLDQDMLPKILFHLHYEYTWRENNEISSISVLCLASCTIPIDCAVAATAIRPNYFIECYNKSKLAVNTINF